MKRRRIKALGGDGIYHCISRLVADAPFLDATALEMMRKQLWRAADFSGVSILTYCLMGNHFHILVKVPDRKKVSITDAELLRRYRVLYPQPTPHECAKIEIIEEILKANGSRAKAFREKLLARMHDVSGFMKTFKQRFSVWYNRTHERYGTLWSDRYKSILIESTPLALRTVAAYIDLNPIRAGLVKDPKDYRWCGYAEAVAGKSQARQGILAIAHPGETGTQNPQVRQREAMAIYRTLLFGKGAGGAPGKTNYASIDAAKANEVLKAGGKLPPHTLLRCRVRYLTDGLVLGTQAFVQKHLEERYLRGEILRKPKPRKLPPDAWQELSIAKSFHDGH